MKTLLVCMMYAGECQYEAAQASLAMQEMRDYDVFHLENMPNRAAHEACYRRFMAEAENYRFFLKFDADFILRDPQVLTRLLAQFDGPEIGCVSIDVADWLSGLSIGGMHIYRSGTIWDCDAAGLFVDGGERLPGSIARLRGLDWVSHNAEPEPYQAFRFGIHRASKALQPDRALGARDMAQAARQHALLQAIARLQLHGSPHPARLWTMLGVELMYRATDRRIMDYAGRYVRLLFEQLDRRPIASYANDIAEAWLHEADAADRWVRHFLLRRVLPHGAQDHHETEREQGAVTR